MTPTTLAETILRDVKLYEPDWAKEPFDRSEMVESTVGDWLSRDEVLAALTAAMDPTIAELAGEVLEGVTPGPWTEHDKGKHPNPYVCGATESYEHGEDQPVVAYVVGLNVEANRRFIAWCREGVPALLTQNAFLLAEINALRAELDYASKEWITHMKQAAKEQDRARKAEAEVEKLRGALCPLSVLPIGDRTADDVPLYGLDERYITHGDIQRARAALTTEADNG